MITLLHRDLINLISAINITNDIGDSIETQTEKQVFANKKSISQTEFYQAASTGLKPELKFVVRSIEYSGELKLSYNGKDYNIIRTYDKNGEEIELTVSRITNNGVT